MFFLREYIANISNPFYSFKLSWFMCYKVGRNHVVTALWHNPEHWILTHLGFHFFWISTPYKKEMASINTGCKERVKYTKLKKKCDSSYLIILNVIFNIKGYTPMQYIWTLCHLIFVGQISFLINKLNKHFCNKELSTDPHISKLDIQIWWVS